MWTLRGKVALVFRSCSETGTRIACELHQNGANVVCTGSSRREVEAVAISVRQHSKPGMWVKAMVVDPASLRSIRAFAELFRKQQPVLHVLVCCTDDQPLRTPAFQSILNGASRSQGVDPVLVSNHLAPFLLTQQLLPLIEQSCCRTVRQGRIVYLCGRTHHFGNAEGLRELRKPPGERTLLDSTPSALAALAIGLASGAGIEGFEALFNERMRAAFQAVADSQLATLLHAYELQRKVSKEGWDHLMHIFGAADHQSAVAALTTAEPRKHQVYVDRPPPLCSWSDELPPSHPSAEAADVRLARELYSSTLTLCAPKVQKPCKPKGPEATELILPPSVSSLSSTSSTSSATYAFQKDARSRDPALRFRSKAKDARRPVVRKTAPATPIAVRSEKSCSSLEDMSDLDHTASADTAATSHVVECTSITESAVTSFAAGGATPPVPYRVSAPLSRGGSHAGFLAKGINMAKRWGKITIESFVTRRATASLNTPRKDHSIGTRTESIPAGTTPDDGENVSNGRMSSEPPVVIPRLALKAPYGQASPDDSIINIAEPASGSRFVTLSTPRERNGSPSLSPGGGGLHADPPAVVAVASDSISVALSTGVHALREGVTPRPSNVEDAENEQDRRIREQRQDADYMHDTRIRERQQSAADDMHDRRSREQQHESSVGDAAVVRLGATGLEAEQRDLQMKEDARITSELEAEALRLAEESRLRAKEEAVVQAQRRAEERIRQHDEDERAKATLLKAKREEEERLQKRGEALRKEAIALARQEMHALEVRWKAEQEAKENTAKLSQTLQEDGIMASQAESYVKEHHASPGREASLRPQQKTLQTNLDSERAAATTKSLQEAYEHAGQCGEKLSESTILQILSQHASEHRNRLSRASKSSNEFGKSVSQEVPMVLVHLDNPNEQELELQPKPTDDSNSVGSLFNGIRSILNIVKVLNELQPKRESASAVIASIVTPPENGHTVATPTSPSSRRPEREMPRIKKEPPPWPSFDESDFSARDEWVLAQKEYELGLLLEARHARDAEDEHNRRKQLALSLLHDAHHSFSQFQLQPHSTAGWKQLQFGQHRVHELLEIEPEHVVGKALRDQMMAAAAASNRRAEIYAMNCLYGQREAAKFDLFAKNRARRLLGKRCTIPISSHLFQHMHKDQAQSKHTSDPALITEADVMVEHVGPCHDGQSSPNEAIIGQYAGDLKVWVHLPLAGSEHRVWISDVQEWLEPAADSFPADRKNTLSMLPSDGQYETAKCQMGSRAALRRKHRLTAGFFSGRKAKALE